jgi:type IV pilus assembly protein PilM
MFFFGKKKINTFLGVDIGESSMKVVELGLSKGRSSLQTYGYAELPMSETGAGILDNAKAMGDILARLCKEAGVKSSTAMVSLPTSNLFSTVLSIPDGKDPRAIQATVYTEVAKLVPLPIQEMVIQTTFFDDDKKIVNEKRKEEKTEKQAKNLRVLATGAAKTLVQKYVETFKAANINLQAIDTEAMALIRSLVGKDKSSIMILDIGGKRSNILIVENGIPFVSRSVTIGGNAVTNQIMRQMGLQEAQAERAKRDIGTINAGASNLAGGLPKLLEPIMLPLVNEIRYALQLYSGMELSRSRKIEKIIVTGGSAHLPRIPEYLSGVLNMNVYRGDPWARVAFPAELSAVLEEIGPRMSVAVGLAMREIE